MNKSKKISVLPHLDTSHRRKSDGKSKFFIKVRISGQAKLYDIQPELVMDKKYWVHEVDPETGKRRKRMRIQHADGNHNSKTLERKLLGKVGEMIDLINDLTKKDHAPSHVLLAERWKGSGAKTLVEYMQWRIEEDSKKSNKRTRSNWHCSLKCIEEYAPKVLLTEIDPKWILDYEEYLRHKKPVRMGSTSKGGVRKVLRYGLAPNSVKSRIAYLGKILKSAYRLDYITKNPLDLFFADRENRKRFTYQAPDRNILEGYEIEQLYKAYMDKKLIRMFENGSKVERNKGERYHRVLQQILASIYTGFRFGDISKFQDELEVSIANDRITLTMQKVNRKHSIKITQKLMEVLSLDECGKLFSGRIYTNSRSNDLLREVMPLLGIDKYLSWHDLRRTFGSYLQEKNVDIKRVSKLMGHTSITTTEKYVKVREKDLDDAMDVWDENVEPDSGTPDDDVRMALQRLIRQNPDLELPAELTKMLPSKPIDREQVFRIVS